MKKFLYVLSAVLILTFVIPFSYEPVSANDIFGNYSQEETGNEENSSISDGYESNEVEQEFGSQDSNSMFPSDEDSNAKSDQSEEENSSESNKDDETEKVDNKTNENNEADKDGKNQKDENNIESNLNDSESEEPSSEEKPQKGFSLVSFIIGAIVGILLTAVTFILVFGNKIFGDENVSNGNDISNISEVEKLVKKIKTEVEKLK